MKKKCGSGNSKKRNSENEECFDDSCGVRYVSVEDTHGENNCNDDDCRESVFDKSKIMIPGDLECNAKKLLSIVEEYAQKGIRQFPLPIDLLAGGNCGSLTSHAAFQKVFASVLKKFLDDVAKIENAPKIILTDPVEMEYLEAGEDDRYPFCGQPGQVFMQLFQGLSNRLTQMNCKDVVIGISGGLDSALTLLVAYTTFKVLKYDISGIHAYTMPGFGTTVRTQKNAQLLCEGLEVKLETIDITEACRLHFKAIGHPEDLHDVVFENAQARERTQILMDKANQVGGIVLGTGDMSEIALGWSTYNGDHMSMFATNSGVPKTAVRDVCMWWADMMECDCIESVNEECDSKTECDSKAEKHFNTLLKASLAVREIVATPVSPELLPAKDGKIAQKTEDKIGPYELHDFFLWHFIAEEESPAQILKAAKKAFKNDYDEATIRKWMDVFFRRLFSQSFKRNCMPDGIRVFKVYFAPDAWHMPSTVSPAAFVKNKQ